MRLKPYEQLAPRFLPARAGIQTALLPWVVALFVGAVIFVLRATNLGRSFDVFIDEVTYHHIGQNVATSLYVTLYGKTFYLHPPAFFFFEAAYLKLLQPVGNQVEQIYSTRYLNIIFASLSGIGLLLIGRRIAGWAAGLAAATLFALDPFIIKMNSLVLLDTSALCWVVLGYWLIISAMHDDQRPLRVWQAVRARSTRAARLFDPLFQEVDADDKGSQVVPMWRFVLAGLLFGLALLTKDMTAFLTLLPLGICFVLNWSIARRGAFTAGITTFATYAIYPITVVLVGDGERFAEQKLRGVLRLAGVVKETGLNRAGGPSLIDTIIARLDQFATTYLIIGLGAASVPILLLLGGRASRLLATWTISAYALLGYCIVLGTLEEQFFYFLVIPSLLTVAVAAMLIIRLGLLRGRWQKIYIGLVVGATVAFSAWTGYQWFNIHFLNPDNGYERVLAYVEQQTPAGSKVAATSETAQFLLDSRASGPWGSWYTPEALQAFSPDYVLITPHTLTWNYGTEAIPLLNWIEQQGTPVFTFRGRGDNLFVLYQLPEAKP